jgi:peptide/nickel transport system permease protein
MAASVTTASAEGTPKSARRRGTIRRVLRTALATTRGKIGLFLTLVIFALAFLGPLVAPGSPTAFSGAPPFTPPGAHSGLLGTDVLGRSVLNRVLYGGWSILVLALVATIVAVLIGAVAGVVSAYRQGRIGGLIMRAVDVFLAFPQLVFVLLIVSVAGAKNWLLVAAVAIVQAPQVARVMFAAAQDICERDFVRAVELWGVPPRRVIARQIFPSLSTPLAVEAGLRLSFSIVIIAGLAFLGFGVQPGYPSWGVMISENEIGMAGNVWGVLAPAIVLAILAVGVNLFTDSVARAAFGEDRAEQTVIAAEIGEGVAQS